MAVLTLVTSGLAGVVMASPQESPAETSVAPEPEPDDRVERFDALLSHLNLTDSQERAVKLNVREMRKAGASKRQIKRAVAAQMHAFGVQRKNLRQTYRGARFLTRYLHRHTDLTDEEIRALTTDVAEMRADGANRTAIADYVVANYDVDRTELRHAVWHVRTHDKKRPRAHRFQHRLLRAQDRHDLTDEQVHSLFERARKLHQNGATPREIRHELRQMVRSYGSEGTAHRPPAEHDRRTQSDDDH
jgi:cytochrome c-type biogenesis protein CcmH/NrfF